MHENREISSTPWETARPVREGAKPYVGHEHDGEVGLCRSTCEPAEQGGAILCGGWGGKGMDRGEHSPSYMFPTQSGKSACTRLAASVRRTSNTAVGIHDKSRVRKRARTDLCGGRSVRIVPTATIIQKPPIPEFYFA